MKSGWFVIKVDSRYDFLITKDHEEFLRIEVKTGRLKNGVITFNACTYRRNGSNRHYRGVADFFGIYCPDNDRRYLIPVDRVGVRTGALRIEPTKNNQLEGIIWADDYEIKEPSEEGVSI